MRKKKNKINKAAEQVAIRKNRRKRKIKVR